MESEMPGLAGVVTRRLASSHLIERRPDEVIQYIGLKNIETNGTPLTSSGKYSILTYLISCDDDKFGRFAARILSFNSNPEWMEEGEA